MDNTKRIRNQYLHQIQLNSTIIFRSDNWQIAKDGELLRMNLHQNKTRIPKDADPVQIILRFAHKIEAARHKNDPLPINDRDEWFVAIVLGLITDPHHLIGRFVGRAAFKAWLRRGGKVPRGGGIPSVIDNEQFLHALLYLHDLGIGVSDLSRAFSFSVERINQLLKEAEDK